MTAVRKLWANMCLLWFAFAVRKRAVFNSVSWNQNRSNYNFQSQQTKTTQWTNENSRQIHVTGAKRGKTHATKSRLVLVLHLIGWEGGASFLNQSQSVVSDYFRHSIENRSMLGWINLSWARPIVIWLKHFFRAWHRLHVFFCFGFAIKGWRNSFTVLKETFITSQEQRENETNRHVIWLIYAFSRAWRRLHASGSDWFTALPALVIDNYDYFGFNWFYKNSLQFITKCFIVPAGLRSWTENTE